MSLHTANELLQSRCREFYRYQSIDEKGFEEVGGKREYSQVAECDRPMD